jgi:hypothetical protein
MNRTHKIVLAAFIFLMLAMLFGPTASKYMKKTSESYMLNPAEILCPNCITGKCDQHGKCS